jgi:Universal stress protein UspA and related nucleotide-binding proteins
MSTVRRILVPLTGSSADEQCLKFAGGLARDLSAHLTAVVAQVDPRQFAALPLTDGMFSYQGVVPALTEAYEVRRERARNTYNNWRQAAGAAESAQAAPGFSCDLQTAQFDAENALCDQALLSDLIVFPRPSVSSGPVESLVEAALFVCGRPVLAVPIGEVPSLRERPGIIAWNGSPEVAHALSAALPLLKLASEIEVVHLGHDSADSESATSPVAEYLAWHELKARTVNIAEKGSPGELLLQHARKRSAGLVVMGAFGHSRARELIFGGTTRHMLDHANVPVLMAH